MRCGGCQTEHPPDASFCTECGAPLRVRCPGCGAENAPAGKFCRGCGRALGATPPAASPSQRTDSPEPYTPPHLIERVLTSRSALEGERKHITVLFVDVKGSLELASQVDPEQWHGIMDRFFAIVTASVHRFEGTVNQYTGDGIMALFGASTSIRSASITSFHSSASATSPTCRPRRSWGCPRFRDWSRCSAGASRSRSA